MNGSIGFWKLLNPAMETETIASSIGNRVSCLVQAMDKKNLYYSGHTHSINWCMYLNAGNACVGKSDRRVEITEATGNNSEGILMLEHLESIVELKKKYPHRFREAPNRSFGVHRSGSSDRRRCDHRGR